MRFFILTTALVISGCAGLVEEKRETVREVGNAVINSDQKCIFYYNDKNTNTLEFYEARCSGKRCKDKKLDCSFE